MIMIDKNDNSLGDVIHIYTLYPGVPCWEVFCFFWGCVIPYCRVRGGNYWFVRCRIGLQEDGIAFVGSHQVTLHDQKPPWFALKIQTCQAGWKIANKSILFFLDMI